MATKRHGYGTSILYDADGVAPFTAITDSTKIKIPKMSRAKSDSTHLESPNMAKEYLSGANAGWIDTDDCVFEAYFTDTQFNTLLSFLVAGTEYFWRVNLPLISGQTNNPYVAMKGYVNSVEFIEIDKDSDDPIKVNFTVQRTTGLLTFTPGS